MKGNIIIPRTSQGFEVAHRFEDGQHRLEIAIGSSFNELYWDVFAGAMLHSPNYQDALQIMIEQGAGWLVNYLPALTSSDPSITSEQLRSMGAGQC